MSEDLLTNEELDNLVELYDKHEFVQRLIAEVRAWRNKALSRGNLDVAMLCSFEAGLEAGREEAHKDLETLAKAVLADEYLWAEAFPAALPVARKVMKEKP